MLSTPNWSAALAAFTPHVMSSSPRRWPSSGEGPGRLTRPAIRARTRPAAAPGGPGPGARSSSSPASACRRGAGLSAKPRRALRSTGHPAEALGEGAQDRGHGGGRSSPGAQGPRLLPTLFTGCSASTSPGRLEPSPAGVPERATAPSLLSNANPLPPGDEQAPLNSYRTCGVLLEVSSFAKLD